MTYYSLTVIEVTQLPWLKEALCTRCYGDLHILGLPNNFLLEGLRHLIEDELEKREQFKTNNKLNWTVPKKKKKKPPKAVVRCNLSLRANSDDGWCAPSVRIAHINLWTIWDVWTLLNKNWCLDLAKWLANYFRLKLVDPL